MAWKNLRARALASPRQALRRARDTLVLSLTQPEERRGEFRLLSPARGSRMTPRGQMLLNVSRSGIAVGIRKKCAFARGETYRVSLDDGTIQADLEGRVCWTRSTWPRKSADSEEGEYFQAAGLVFARPLTADQEERWQSLRDLVQDGSAELDLKISPVR